MALGKPCGKACSLRPRVTVDMVYKVPTVHRRVNFCLRTVARSAIIVVALWWEKMPSAAALATIAAAKTMPSIVLTREDEGELGIRKTNAGNTRRPRGGCRARQR